MKNSLAKKNILRARAAYRGENCGVGELGAKSRMVLVGCGEPDLEHLQRNTPTPTRASFFFAIQVFASSCMSPRLCWHLVTGDVEAAFLQGARESHTSLLCMAHPRDPFLEATGCWQEFDLAEITGSIYRRVNAPWCCLQGVLRRMRRLDCVPHSLDLLCFLHYDKAGTFRAVIAFHVDGALAVWTDWFDIKRFKASFEWVIVAGVARARSSGLAAN